MRHSFTVVAVVALSAMTGCVNVPKQAFNRDASTIKTIVVVVPEDQSRYEAMVVAHPGTNFGLIGGLIAMADMEMKTSRLTEALDPKEMRLQARFTEKLEASLVSAGYRVRVTRVPRDTADEQFVSFASTQPESIDAVLGIRPIGRYTAAGAASDYFPQVIVKAKAIEVASQRTLYEDTFTYGYAMTGMKSVHFGADVAYRFPNMDALTADPAKARAGLLGGIDPIVGQIASDLRRP